MSLATEPHIETVGAGADLVLLHGWGMNSEIWSGIVEPLSEHYRLHLVDLPGFGHSYQLLPARYALDAVLELILPALPARAHWLGWSLGGMLALRAAAWHRQRVARLITVASSPCFVGQDSWPGVPAQTLAQFSESLLVDHDKTLRQFMALQAMGCAQAKSQIRQLRERLLARPAPALSALAGGLEILAKDDLRPDCRQVTQPWLRLYGQRDTLVPVALRATIDRCYPNGQSRIIDQTGHAPFLSHPQQFVQLVCQFIDASTSKSDRLAW